MASRNPLLDAMTGGGSENPLLDALSASTVDATGIASVTGRQPSRTPLPRVSDGIVDPNSYQGVMAARAAEKTRLPGERGAGDVRAPAADTASILRGLGITTIEAWKQAGTGIKMQAQDLLGPQIDAWIESNMPSAMTQDEQRAAFGATPTERDFARSKARSEAATPAFESDLGEAVYGGLQSTLQTAPGIAAGILGGAPAGLAVLGAQTEGQAYGKYRERGATGLEATLGAVGESATEVATELLPMGFLVSRFGKAGAGEFLTGLLAREVPTEQIATIVQDALDTAIANPNKSWQDYRDERGDAAFKTLVATVVQSGIYGGAGAAARVAGGRTDPVDPAYTAGVDQAAREAMRPDKEDVPLSQDDRASAIPDDVLQRGKNALADALGEVRPTKAATPREAVAKVAPAADTFGRMVQITLGSESNNRDLDANGNVLTSSAGAKGRMQVLDSTNRDPGFGVRPAANDSLEERARVGRDYLAALLRRYKGDPAKMWASYNWGAGNLDNAIAEHGGDWLSHAPSETRAYVMKNLSKLGREGFDTQTGEVATIAPPEQAQMDSEDPIAFAARVLGEDFLNSNSQPEEIGQNAQETAPLSTNQTPEEITQSGPASNEQGSVSAPVGMDQLTVPNAPTNIRGEAIDAEWTAFAPDSGSLNIPRATMPQIDAEHRGAFANFLKGRGIQSREVEVDPATLKPSQREFSEARVARARDREGGDRAIVISSDGYIVDGHHQWMAARDQGQPIRAIELDAPFQTVAAEAAEFPSSFTDGAKTIRQGRSRANADNTEQDLLSFIAANGGILDDRSQGNSLRASRNLQRFIPGMGALIRDKGLPIDSIRERLVETGWIPESASTADVLDLIENASFRPVYHPASQRGERDAVNADEQEGRQDEARALVRLEAERLGLQTLTDRDLDRAAEMTVADGYSERDALFAALERAMAEDFTTYPEKAQEEYNVPFDDAGAKGWQAVQDPFAEPETGSADQEGGERPAPIERAAEPSESAPVRSSEVEGGASVEDTPSGKGVIVRGATDAQLAAIKAALPENASGMAGRDGGVTYSKKHEAKIREALATPATIEVEDPALTDNERTALEYVMRSDRNGGEGLAKDSSAGAQVQAILDAGSTQNASDERLLETAMRLRDRKEKLGTPPEGRTADAAQASPPASAPTVKVYRSGTGGNGGWFTTSRTYAEQLAARDATPLWEGEIPRSDPVFADADVNDPGLQLTYQRDFAPGEISNVKKVAEAPERVTETVTPAAPRQFEGNRLFTADRVEAARARLKEKLSGTTLNSGIDPEVLMDGMTVAGAYIESGIRRFADVARALSTDLGQSMSQLRPYLAAWYNGARDLLEGQGEDIADMDGPGAVRAALTMIEDQARGAPVEAGAGVIADENPAETEGAATSAQPGRLEAAFVDAFMAGRAFASITEARAFAAEIMGERIAPGTAQAKTLDEAIESAVVRAARKIAVQNEADPVAAYQRLVQLYAQQPTLGVRTSTSIEQQAYSTPVPLSYLASRLAGINQNTTVYEPSAGNGALLIDARATYVTANELNPARAASLRDFLRGATVTENDAAEYRPAGQFDAVIANPPFGPVKDDAGNTVRFQVDAQYSTNEIDHAIAMRALEAMADTGRAVLIVGGINKKILDPRERADAYNGKAKREFYFKLYSQYNVVDHFTVDGSLYAKQGAGWPVDVIVIAGRGKSSLRLPAVSAPPQFASWDALQEKINGRNAASAGAVRGANGSPAAQGARPVATDVGNSGRVGERGDNGRAGRDQAQQPVPVRDGPVDGQSGSVRMDAERAPVDQAALDREPGSTAGRDPAVEQPQVEENERQVAYRPGSASSAMGTLVPVNMQAAIDDALADLAQRRGSIDAYVQDRLGYTSAQLRESFGAEQVDAIALAVDNIERNAGFIIGDQTGIGKGRVNAAIIRYAIRQGKNAIFVTEKPNLYADMFRDMEDIGIDKMLGREINAVMTNVGVTVPLDEEGKRRLRSGSDAKKHEAMLADLANKGLKASGVDLLMTTYSQMQTLKGNATVRQDIIRALANGGIVMFDESHNAGGTQNAFKEKGAAPNRAEFARELVKNADGVFYSSATYAKRPDVMDLYAATDMKLAVDDLEKLGEAIAKGGVPMQQVVAAMLARSGQYVRRERSFDGIAYNTPVIEVDRTQYNNVASVLAAIQDFSEGYVSDAVARIDEDLRAEAESVAGDNSIGNAGATSTNFTAIMHNVVDQMLLAFAADAAADRAIATIRAGEKPVVTLASTLETFIEEYASDAQVGDKIEITFSDIFDRYLERTRRYTVKKPFAPKGDKGERRRLTDAQLGPAGVQAFNEARQLINDAGLDTLPGSPIDYIIAKIEAAGYSVGEITGRGLGVDYRPEGAFLKRRGQDVRSIKGRLSTINGFNSGSIDAIILNKSGSTGLSLHASEKFKDQRKRKMIIVQAEGNIDTHMQMLGRVHRTGQVILPEYDQMVVGVPAARRPAAVLAKKMASLNANTTASRDSALTSSEVLDFMNVYGDEIAARMMEDEPDIHMRLGSPLSETDKGGLNREEAARKVTGRIPLLPIDIQEELYQRLEDEYRTLLAQKDASGENALEAKTLDFDAQTVERIEAVPAKMGSTSPFADGVFVENVRVKRTGRPMPGADVIAEVASALDAAVPQGDPRTALAAIQSEATATNATRLRETVSNAREYIGTAVAAIKAEDKQAAERDKLNATLKDFEAIRKSFKPGDTVRIKTDNGNVYGVVLDVYRGGRAKNPAALGVWRARFAIVDAAREMTISFSQLQVPGKEEPGRIAIEQASTMGLFNIIDAFDQMQVESREPRTIVTGNMLAGFDYVNGKGAIINYTVPGGQVRQGILMPRDFNLEKHQAAKPIILSTPEMVDAYLREGGGTIIGLGKTGQVSLTAVPRRDTFIITAARAKSSGGEFFLNRDLTAIMGDFVSKSNGMVADSSLSRAIPAIRALMESGVKFEVPGGAKDNDKEMARVIVNRLRPPAPPVETVIKSQPETSIDVSTVSQETFRNWKKSVDSVGTTIGWTIFNDEVGGGFVLMNDTRRAGPFGNEQEARDWARTAASDFTDVAQPERAMTQRQSAELAARQQQGMARRGGQEAVSDQSGGLFSAERDQDSMFSLTEDEGGDAAADWQAIVPRLDASLKRLGLADKVTLQAVDQIFNNPNIAGRYRARIIQVAMSTSQNPEYTLEHEAIHAIKDMGLFRPSEWNALASAARRDTRLMESVRARYPRLNDERQMEEAIADMFAQWRAGRRSQSGFVRQALQRLLDFLTAIRRAVAGSNAQDEVMDILRRLESGDIGGRDPDGPGGGGARDSRIGEAANALLSSGAVDTIRDQVDVWRTKLQDRFLPLLRAQQRIEMQSGKPVAEGSDAYMAEELMTGKVGARLERLADELVNPLFDTMKGLGVTVDELETYLYARHAAERNERISTINSQFAEGEGSGMTDAEAAGILARADAEGKIAALEQAAERVDAILKFAIDTRVDAGLLSQEEADTWRETYQFYVPLRGRGELEPETGGADRPRFGSGINVRGKESKRAFGRKSRAANILAYSIMQAEEAIARAGRNDVAQAFYRLAQQNPDPDFWTTNRVTRKPVWNEASGTVSYRNDSQIRPEDEPFTVSLKISGQERRVTMNRDNPVAARLAASMRNLDAPAISGPLRIMSQFNRYLSRVNTGLNPEFVITNAFRDIQTATVNLAGVDSKGIVAGTLRDYRAAMVASVKANVRKDESGDWGKWYREFVDAGGRVYFNHIEDVADIAKRIEKQASARATGADGAKMRTKAIIKGAFEFIDNLNTGLENAVRLAAYKNAREGGMSKAQAASLAKNLTVNFNRRGDWGVAMNAMYLFYNASVQGTARMLQAIATPGKGGQRVRRILFGVAATSFALEMLNAMMSGDDDDGESFYDKISDFDKSRNLIVMIPGGENGRHLKIPMPYGYNVFATIGRSIAATMRGRPVSEGLGTIVGDMVDAFNPVGGTNSILNLIAPSIVDPVVDLYRNRDFADRPIYREQQPYGPEEPNSQMYWGAGPPVWREMTSALNSVTGGDAVLPGAVDINPEILQHLWGVGTGAAGTFVADRIIGTGYDALSGNWSEIDANDLPLSRKLTGTKPGWYDKAAFYARTEEVEQVASRPKEYAERGMYDAADAYARANDAALGLVPAVKAAKKELRKIKSARGDVEGALGRKEITDAQASAERLTLKDAEKEVITRFNAEYIRVIANPKRP